MFKAICFFLLLLSFKGFPQNPANNKVRLLTEADFQFLKELTRDVVESSRIYPGQKISENFGPNNTGGILIRPGGRESYPSFWIRDYAMSIESGFVFPAEQKHMLLLTASTQCDQSWITKDGCLVPLGAIADHIRIDDSLPIYFPGTYSFGEQGNPRFGRVPPYCDQFYFIQMAFLYVQSTSDTSILNRVINGRRLIDRLETAFGVPPSDLKTQLVFTTDEFRGVDFGFRDVITMTGSLSFPSILKYRAAIQMADLLQGQGETEKSAGYREITAKIRTSFSKVFSDPGGMMHASTGKSSQCDVWGTALAVYYDLLDEPEKGKACRKLADSYKNGSLAYKGNIRHVLIGDDFSPNTVWEFSLARKDTYQNGAYWGTPTGWVCRAIAEADPESARKLAAEYILDLRENDYRKGKNYGAPWECFHPSGHRQNPVYMATVTCPYIVFRNLQ